MKFPNLTDAAIVLVEPLADTPSGSIAKKTPRAKSGSRPPTACRASTAAWCCWTSAPWGRRACTTSCWSPATWPSWRSSTASGATWATRTSSPWSAWSIPSSSTLWRAAGTGSCAPGGGTTATATSFRCTTSAAAPSTSTTATVTPPFPTTDHSASEEVCFVPDPPPPTPAAFWQRKVIDSFLYLYTTYGTYAPCWSRGSVRDHKTLLFLCL